MLTCGVPATTSKCVVVVTVGGNEYVIIVSFKGASGTDFCGVFGTRSGKGPAGAVPYLNSFESAGGEDDFASRSWPPDPVDPTRVTELRLDGEEGPLSVLSVSVSKLFEVAIEVLGIDK